MECEVGMNCAPPDQSPAARRLRRRTLAGVSFDLGFALHRSGGDLRLGPHDIDAALEVGAIVDADAGALDVADETAFVADGNLLGDLNIAPNASENNHFASFDIGLDLAVRAHCDQALRFEHALYFAV